MMIFLAGVRIIRRKGDAAGHSQTDQLICTNFKQLAVTAKSQMMDIPCMKTTKQSRELGNASQS